jgi:hypothetical protein
MDLRQFYDRVAVLIGDLREAGPNAEAERIENALRGGTTSGEVLGALSVALGSAAKAVPNMAAEINELARWAEATWRSSK